MPSKVSVLRHRKVTEQEHSIFLVKLRLSLKQIQSLALITNISYPDYTAGRGVGYDRNFLLQHGSEDFCYMIDQDNEF
jgi:16S rRNA C1402 N4-methylase RsmH